MSAASSAALGNAALIGVGASSGLALGTNAHVLDGHAGSTAIGFSSRTSAAYRVDIGAGIFLATNKNHASADHFSVHNSSYRLAGLAALEDDLDDLFDATDPGANKHLLSQTVRDELQGLINAEGGFTSLTRLGDIAEVQATFSDQDIIDRNAIIKRYRDNAANRVLQVNGHGDLVAMSADQVNIGTVGDAADASGSIYSRIADLNSRVGSGGGGESYDDTAVRGLISGNADAIGSYSDPASDAESASLHARINKNRADIASFQSSGVSSDTMAQIQGNTQAAARASQGVALSNALASLPKALLPGERLRLGIGVGSFDGKSGTAIGVMGKWGASTLLNAGFSTGGGESSTQVGISWGW